MIRHSGMMFGSSLLQNGLNFGFWLVMVRLLAPVQYGVLNTLVSVVGFFSANGNILQTVVTRYVSLFAARGEREKARAFLRGMAQLVGVSSVALFFVFLAVRRPVLGFFHLEDGVLILLAASGIVLSLFSALTTGMIQGLQLFDRLAFCNVIGGFVKLAVGLLLVLAASQARGAFTGFLAQSAFIVAFCYFMAPAWLRSGLWRGSRAAPVPPGQVAGYAAPVFLATLAFFLLTNIDIILVKHFFAPLDAGYYSVAQVTGKIALFFPSAVGIVMFPKVVDAHAQNREVLPILKKCLTMVGVLCCPVILATSAWPGTALFLLTGSTPAAAVALVRYFGLSMSLFALTQILMLFHLSRHDNRFIYLMAAAAAAQTLLVWRFHASLEQVIRVLLAVSVVLFAAGLVMTRPGRHRERP
ncbi:MAG: oligosaccharide flippase family protein [Deltaproteobacteria bacterium]